jgi:3-hydroxybutyryl-CoA dehydrogenase
MSATESPPEAIERVGIIGGGIMGSGIAEVCARAGLEVVLVEVDDAAAETASLRVRRSVDRAVQRGKLEAEDAGQMLELLTCVSDIAALADRQIVIEAVVESRAAKLDVFGQLARVVDDADAILASNTSSIPIVELAVASGDRAGHVLGLHFFNPVPVLSLVEIISSLLTSEETAVLRRAP